MLLWSELFLKMKIHTTNYINTFIEVAEDCPVAHSVVPPTKQEKSAALLQYEMLINNPYQYTSDDVIFECFAIKKGISAEDEKRFERDLYFSKGRACFRASPLTKRYGFGVHNNEKGKIALIPMESAEYQNFLNNTAIKKVKAMRTKK